MYPEHDTTKLVNTLYSQIRAADVMTTDPVHSLTTPTVARTWRGIDWAGVSTTVHHDQTKSSVVARTPLNR